MVFDTNLSTLGRGAAGWDGPSLGKCHLWQHLAGGCGMALLRWCDCIEVVWLSWHRGSCEVCILGNTGRLDAAGPNPARMPRRRPGGFTKGQPPPWFAAGNRRPRRTRRWKPLGTLQERVCSVVTRGPATVVHGSAGGRQLCHPRARKPPVQEMRGPSSASRRALIEARRARSPRCRWSRRHLHLPTPSPLGLAKRRSP